MQQSTGSTQAQPAGLDKVSQHSPGVQTPPASATGLKHSCVYPAFLRGNGFQTNTVLSWEEKHTISSSQPAFLCKLLQALLPTAPCLLAPVTQPGHGSGKCHQGFFRDTQPKQLHCLAICCPFAGLCHLDLSSLTLIQLSATLKSFLKYLPCAPSCSKPLEQVQLGLLGDELPAAPGPRAATFKWNLSGRSPWLWELSRSTTEPLPGGLTLQINQMEGAECARKKTYQLE